MAIFITGATGFIGEKLALRLAERGETVHAIVRNLEKAKKDLAHPNIKLFKGDITKTDTLKLAMKGCDKAYHLAAYATQYARDQRTFFEINVQSTANVMEAAKAVGLKKTVVTSTLGTLGPQDPRNDFPTDEKSIRWLDFFAEYESSKLLADEKVLQYVQNEGMDAVIVLPTRVFGPGELNLKNGITRMIHTYSNSKNTVIPGNGRTIGNYVYVEDVLDGMELAMEKGRAGHKYIIGGDNLTYDQLFNVVYAVTGKKGRIIRIPFWVIKTVARFEVMKAGVFGGSAKVVPGFARRFSYDWSASIEKAKSELGYSPLTIKQGIDKTVKWLENDYNKNGSSN